MTTFQKILLGTAFLALFGVVIHQFRVVPRLAPDPPVTQRQTEAADIDLQARQVVIQENAPAIAVDAEDPGLIAGNVFLENNPRAKELLVRSKRAFWANYYFPLYLKLGLDDARATRLEEILSANGAADSFPAPDGAAYSRLRLRAFAPLSAAERETQIRELLGDDGYRAFTAYSIEGVSDAMRVASGLYFTEAPLTASQAQDVAQIFQSNQGSPRSWEKTLAEALGVLTPTQLAPLQALQASDDLASARRSLAAQDTTGTPASKDSSSRPAISLATQLAQDANEPQIQLLSLALKRAQFAQDYGPLLQSRAVAPEIVSQLTEAFVSRESLAADVDAIIGARSLRRDDEEAAAVRAGGEAQFEVRLTELLGTEALSDWREYERSLPARNYVSQLAGVAAVAGIPFTSEQADRLTAAVAAANASFVAGGKLNLQQQNWEAATANAARILSPAQLQLFNRVDPLPSRRWSSQFAQLVLTSELFATPKKEK